MITWSQRDRALIWHPFSQEKTADLPVCITRGEGAYLLDENNQRYLDLMSSWWVNLHGHAHPKIADAIYRQACELEHVMFAGFTHKPAIELCEGLRHILPDELTRFFFSDNGSTAVEIALKMAYQFWLNQGETKRTIFLSFDGAYHGDTFGAMSVGKSSGFHDAFQKLFFQVHTIPYPATWQHDANVVAKEQHALLMLDKFLAQHADSTAAFIAEPLMQGASGMRFCRPEFLQAVVDRIQSHNILIIFDEVMTGFGRTGTLFATEQVARSPDIICLSKGWTAGFLPLALTVANNKIYDAFLSNSYSTAFSHGHSYTANPLGCAAAVASLNLLTQKETIEKIGLISAIHSQRIAQLVEKFAHVVAPRTLGTIGAFNIDDTTTHYSHPLTPSLKKEFLAQGLLIRPLGNTVYLLPPYCVIGEELHDAYDKIEMVLRR